jgi:hypothetical protein
MSELTITQAIKRAALALFFALSSLHAGFADAKKPAVDCEALGRFANLSLTNRLIGVPYQPTASNMYIDTPYSPERTTQSSKGAIFNEAYEESSLHKTPEAFGAEVKQHCLRGEFLK